MNETLPAANFSLSKRPPKSLVMRFASEEATRAGIPVGEIFAHTRARLPAWARGRVMRRLRDLGYSFPGIGLVMDRDHSSVLVALKKQFPDTPPSATRAYRRRLKRIYAMAEADGGHDAKGGA